MTIAPGSSSILSKAKQIPLICSISTEEALSSDIMKTIFPANIFIKRETGSLVLTDGKTALKDLPGITGSSSTQEIETIVENKLVPLKEGLEQLGVDLEALDLKLTSTAEELSKGIVNVNKRVDDIVQVAFIQKVLDWKHFNVRGYGERGEVELQGFTQDGGIPITYTKEVLDHALETVICLPADASQGTNLSNCARMSNLFDDALWDDISKYGATYSGRSRLGTEYMINGNAGGFTGVLDQFKDGNPYGRMVIAFNGVPSGDESYVRVTSTDSRHITQSLILNGADGVPTVKVGEWFEWEVTIPPNFDTSTQMDIRINGQLIPSKLKYLITTFSGLGSCLKVGNWFMLTGGKYSYHQHVGVTIMQTETHKVFTNADLEGSDIYTIVTPEGKFDLTCEASDDIDPLKVGHTLQIIAMNVHGSLRFIGNPKFLINGIRENAIPVMHRLALTGVNTSATSINYSMDLSPVLG